MKLLVVNNGTSYLKPLLKCLSPHNITVVTRKQLPKIDVETFDAIILSGGHSLTIANHEREYANELKLIREGARPVIGICLGFELIARAFGATLRRLGKKENGIVQIKSNRPHPILDGLARIEVFESHRWVVKNVRAPLVKLASSKDGCEIVIHKSKLIFGFQFHPEMFPDQTTGQKILKNCLKYIRHNFKK